MCIKIVIYHLCVYTGQPEAALQQKWTAPKKYSASITWIWHFVGYWIIGFIRWILYTHVEIMVIEFCLCFYWILGLKWVYHIEDFWYMFLIWGIDLILLASVIKINLNQFFFLPSIKLVLQTFVLCLIPEGITHLIKHRRLQSNCIIHLIVFSIHLQSFSIQFLIVSVVTVSYYATPCLVISIYTPPQKFSI